MRVRIRALAFVYLPFVFTLFALAVAPHATEAQTRNSGSIAGTVTDPSGAAVPGAVVQVRNPVSGFDRSATTDQNGAFSLHGITPGSYQAYAWASAPASAFRSDEFMKPFAANGTPVRLELNGSTKIALTILDYGS